MDRALARIVLALALATATAAAGACDKTDSAAKPTETKPAEAKPAEAKPTEATPGELAKPDFTITARDLYAEFRPQIEAGTADAVRAKYTGKTVRISGVVKANADMMGTWELSLVANDKTGLAFVHPSTAGAADVKALKAGDNVTLQCVSEGWEIGPQLKDCVVVK
jgi:hypothetical protein